MNVEGAAAEVCIHAPALALTKFAPGRAVGRAGAPAAGPGPLEKRELRVTMRLALLVFLDRFMAPATAEQDKGGTVRVRGNRCATQERLRLDGGWGGEFAHTA